jgi:agmatinase
MSIQTQTDASVVPRYCGISTFARLPLGKDLHHVDIGIIGIPFDGGCTFRTGARFGPEAIRKSSRLLRGYNVAQDHYPFRDKQVADMGDIVCTPFDNQKAVDQIYRELKTQLSSIQSPIFMGGDHTISYPILKAMQDKHNIQGGIALLHFDSHMDTWEEYFDEKITHGTPFKRAFQEGLIHKDHSIHVGIRGSTYSKDDFKDDEALGFKVIPCSDIIDKDIGVDGIVKKIKERVGNHYCYISIDVDVVDPAFAPGTGTPECGGFSSLEMLTILRKCKGLRVLGGDVVEVCPSYDHADITGQLAATLCYELISLL